MGELSSVKLIYFRRVRTKYWNINNIYRDTEIQSIWRILPQTADISLSFLDAWLRSDQQPWERVIIMRSIRYSYKLVISWLDHHQLTDLEMNSFSPPGPVSPRCFLTWSGLSLVWLSPQLPTPLLSLFTSSLVITWMMSVVLRVLDRESRTYNTVFSLYWHYHHHQLTCLSPSWSSVVWSSR